MYRTLIDGFPANGDPTKFRINFEQFCALASESSWTRTKSNGVSCESEIPSVWNIFCRKASNFLRRAIVHPFNHFLGISNFSIKFSSRSLALNIYNSYTSCKFFIMSLFKCNIIIEHVVDFTYLVK